MKAWLRTHDEKKRAQEFLDQNGTFLSSVTKRDTYFARNNATTFDFRIREINGTYTVTQKHHQLVGNIEQNEELEFEVSSKENFMALVNKLGYVIFLEKTKISQIWNLNFCLPRTEKTHDQNESINLTAEIITLPQLGDFLEIEALCSEDEIQTARTALQYIFDTLHLTQNIERQQYSKLLGK